MESSVADAGITSSLCCLQGGFSCVFGIIWLLVMAISVVGIIFWILMLIDLVKREDDQFGSESKDQKMLWLLIVLLTSYVGALVYYFMVYKKVGKAK